MNERYMLHFVYNKMKKKAKTDEALLLVYN